MIIFRIYEQLSVLAISILFLKSAYLLLSDLGNDNNKYMFEIIINKLSNPMGNSEFTITL